MSVQIQQRQQTESTERWACALDRALHSGIEIYTTANGERFAISAIRHDLVYHVTPDTCDCSAAQAGDPVGPHRAALRSILGSLPVLMLRIDELIPANAPRCAVCWGAGERWAGSVDDERNPQRFIACPECQGTGHNLNAIIRAA